MPITITNRNLLQKKKSGWCELQEVSGTLVQNYKDNAEVKEVQFYRIGPPFFKAPRRGLEPRTRWLTAICSTD